MNKKFTKLIAALALLVFMTPSLAGWGQTTYDWVETAFSDLTTSDVFVIIGTQSNTNYALSTNAANAVEVTIANGKITSEVEDALTWKLVEVENQVDQYYLQTGTNANNYLYNKKKSNGSWDTGLAIGTKYSAGNIFTYTSYEDVNYLKVVASERYVCKYSSGSNWRAYLANNIIETPTTFYKKQSATPALTSNVAMTSVDNVDLTATYGTSTLTEGNDADIEQGTQLTLAYANVASGKVFDSWVITDEDDTNVTSAVLEGNILTVPAYDITISATLRDAQQYTVTFDAGTGTAVSPITGFEGSSITLPTTTPSAACASRGWEFAGWVTASVSETTTAPALLSGEYPLNGNATLYAVYKVTEGDGGEQEFDFPAIAVANGWENGEAYTEVTIGQVTITAQGGGNNGKWYTSGGGSWRMYNGGTVEISAANNAVTAVTSTPACDFTISNGIATFSPSARTDFTNITVTYGSSTTTYNSNPSCSPMVATPTFTPAEGTYTGAQNVTINCTTEDASISYKTTEEGEWLTYNNPIPVSTTTTIWAKATKNEMDDSEIASATYTIQYTLTVDIDDDLVEYFLFDYTNGTWVDIELDDEGQALVSSGADVRISGGEVYDDCYEVESFNVTDGNSPIAVNYISESMEYSFIMPASNATLTATLNEIANHYTLTVEGLDYVSFELLVGSMSKITTLDANQASICEESEVTISELTVGTGRVLESVTLTYGNQTTEITPTSGVYVFEMPSSNATLTFTTDTAPTYTLANSIVSGKTYIISDGVDRAMGAQSGNVRSAATITIDNNVATVTNTDVYEFVISGSAEDGYTIYDVKDEGYLYASSSTSNNIGTRAENSDGNSVWTIDFDESAVTITANGTNTRNYIRYNYNNGNDRFSCYASTSSLQDPLYLYVKDETPVTETYDLTINGYGSSTTEGWNLIASPVSTTPDQVTNMLTEETTAPYSYDLYRFNQTAGSEWENYHQHSGDFNIIPGQGYLYANKGDVNNNPNTVTLTFTGVPYDGDGEIELVYSETNGDSNMWGWNLIGNPYSVNAEISADYYMMNPAGSELIANDGYIVEAMQGVFVQAESESETVIFDPQSRAKSNHNDNKVVIDISHNRGIIVDRAIVRFGEGRQLPKMQLFENSTKLYIPQDNKDYAMVRTEAQGEMPVNFKAAENGTYTLTVNPENVEMNYLHLIDNMTGADIDLLANPSYTFNATTRDYESRFTLVFAADASTGSASDETFAFFSNGNLIVNNNGEATLQVIDITGRILSSETVNGSVSKDINAAPGVYMLRLINGNNVKVQKIVVR